MFITSSVSHFSISASLSMSFSHIWSSLLTRKCLFGPRLDERVVEDFVGSYHLSSHHFFISCSLLLTTYWTNMVNVMRRCQAGQLGKERITSAATRNNNRLLLPCLLWSLDPFLFRPSNSRFFAVLPPPPPATRTLARARPSNLDKSIPAMRVYGVIAVYLASTSVPVELVTVCLVPPALAFPFLVPAAPPPPGSWSDCRPTVP